MPRNRRMVAPIMALKHYVSKTESILAIGGVLNQVVVTAVSQSAAGGTAADVLEGSLIKAVHFEFWIQNDGAANTTSQFIVIVEKVPAGQAGANAAAMLNLGSYANKKNVLWSSQGTIPSLINGSGALPVIRNWVLIPKGKQRFGLGDRLMITLHTVSQTLINCGLFTYKEYR